MLPFIRILASKINFSFDIKCTSIKSLEDLLLNANDIPIMIEKEFIMYTKGNGKQKSTVN